MLKEKYTNIVRNYKEIRYPFKCDFYIPELDLFIEYQGSQYHHKHAFDKENKNDVNELNRLIEKANNSKRKQEGKKSQWDNIIETWTIRDVNKRETAKKNNINYLEFFTLEEFNKWFEKQ